MATLNVFILITAAISTIKKKCIVAVPWKKW